MKRNQHIPGCLLVLVFLISLFQTACTTEDVDLDEIFALRIMLSSYNIEISPGQTVTITASLMDGLGRPQRGIWDGVACDDGDIIARVVVTPLGDTSTASVAITANPIFYLVEGQGSDSWLYAAHAFPVSVIAGTMDPKTKSATRTLYVKPKGTQLSVQKQSLSVDLVHSTVNGKCTFSIKNDVSSDTFQWQKLSITGGIHYFADDLTPFTEAAEVGQPVIQGRTAEFSWTQKLSTAVPANGSVVFYLQVGAQSPKSPLLTCICTPGAKVFYSNQAK
jgi:hypothetical protein